LTILPAATKRAHIAEHGKCAPLWDLHRNGCQGRQGGVLGRRRSSVSGNTSRPTADSARLETNPDPTSAQNSLGSGTENECQQRAAATAQFHPMKQARRPRDFSQAAKLVIDIASGQTDNERPLAPEARGRAGGLKGGAARAKTLDPQKRREIARKAAASRWGKKPT
jgi:hypothetical protein